MHFCSTPLGENTWKLRTFLWTLPHAPFPFADLNLYPLLQSAITLGITKTNKHKGKALATLPRPFLRIVFPASSLEGEEMCLSGQRVLPLTRQQQVPQAHCSSPIMNSLCTYHPYGPPMLPLWNLGGKKNECTHDAEAAC